MDVVNEGKMRYYLKTTSKDNNLLHPNGQIYNVPISITSSFPRIDIYCSHESCMTEEYTGEPLLVFTNAIRNNNYNMLVQGFPTNHGIPAWY